MKSIGTSFIILISILGFSHFSVSAQNLNGTWEMQQNDEIITILIQDSYYVLTAYTKTKFNYTLGGKITYDAQQATISELFDSAEKELKTQSIAYQIEGETLTWGDFKLIRKDDSTAPLSGVWKIGKRKSNGELVTIHQRGTRQTLKILTGTRFQWIAFDPDGNKFSGTGGGHYSFENGKYIEHIDFFSRDNSRVGASLTFDGSIENGDWIHSGLSSKGDPIYEVWMKLN